MVPMKLRYLLALLLIVLFSSVGLMAAPENENLPTALQNLSVGGVMYLSYQNGRHYAGNAYTAYNAFTLKRGYLDVRKGFGDNFMVRYTTDITRSGGSWNTRIKYLYGKFAWENIWELTQPAVGFGQVHVPWIDFEEAINGYRMQGTMFLERFGILNSADDGVTFSSNIGGEMNQTYQSEVSSHYAGYYGSIQIGIYNGGGYHAQENNLNKVIESRVTARPAPNALPGLQVSAFGIAGKGNLAPVPGSSPPAWNGLDMMVSYQSSQVTATGQFYTGKGNQGGTAIHPATRAARAQSGYSIFGAYRLHESGQYSVIARLDAFDTHANDIMSLFIAGIAWDMNSTATWLLDYQRLSHSLAGLSPEDQIQLTLQAKF